MGEMAESVEQNRIGRSQSMQSQMSCDAEPITPRHTRAMDSQNYFSADLSQDAIAGVSLSNIRLGKYFILHGADRLCFSLTLKAPPIICSRRQLKFCSFFKNNKQGMIFHENRLLANDSHVISYLIYRKLGKMSQNLLSAAVVIGALRVKNVSN